MRYIVMLTLLTLVFADLTPASSLSNSLSVPEVACYYRPTYRSQPWLTVALGACLEEVINDPSAGELSFTALATAPDGTLYAARPLTGEVVALTDTNGDELPDSVQIVADGLTLPNGLDYHDGALYVSGGSHIYRLKDGTLQTLVSDLPSGGGFWTGGIAISDNGRMYVATGSPCDFCVSSDPARGAILSFALDGSDRQTVATGLRQPSDLAFQGSDLYVVDSARSGLFDTPDLDELDRLQPDAQLSVNFGFPYCIGLKNTPDMSGFDCTQTTPPMLALPTASTPTGIVAYRGDAIPLLEGKLLVVLSGAYNDLDLRGYQLIAVDPLAGSYTTLMPTRPDNNPLSDFSSDEINYRGGGFFPHRPLGVAVNEQGWVYVSVGGGRILALRSVKTS